MYNPCNEREIVQNGMVHLMRWFRVFVGMTIIASLCIGLGFTPDQAIAADITVGNGIYACSRDGLADAILEASPGGTVTFDCNPATITFDRQIEITNNVTIDGSNNGSPITLDGNGATRFFYVTSGTLTLQHMTLKDGQASEGGALYIDDNDKAEIIDVTLDSNEATTYGGAIYNEGTLAITESTFDSNKAVARGAIVNGGSLTTTQSTFDSNMATVFGGAILNDISGNLTITESTFTSNSTGNDGGAIENYGSLTIQRSSFVNNHSDDIGGAIDAWNGSTTIIASTLTGNTADGIHEEGTGSAIYISEFADKVLIIGSTIVQPQNTTPALYIHENDAVTLKAVILGGDGQHCDFDNGDLADAHTLSNDSSCGLQGVSSHQNTNLGLGPLTTATIDGVEQTYYPLLEDSPAIDGSLTTICPSADPSENLDQIGTPRPQGATCDVGAIESPFTGSQVLCANRWNGALSYGTGCDRSSTPALISADGYLDLCVNRWNSATRMSDRCSRSEHHLSVAATQSIPICINRWNSTIRATDRCTRSETPSWL